MILETAAGVRLAVRAQPGARTTAITGVYGEGADAQLKIAVHARPMEGRANDALVDYLSVVFSLPRGSIVLVSGATSRNKVFLLKGARLPQIHAALARQ
jgi:uncharacterized protein (TIGR00251 family)